MPGLWSWVGLWASFQSGFLYLNTHFPNIFNSVSVQETLSGLFYASCIELGLGNTKINQTLYLYFRGRQIYEQRMTTQGDIYYDRGQPGGHDGPEQEPRGSERSHFLPLALCGLWRTLTHCEISDRSHLFSGLSFHSAHSKAPGLSGSQKSSPMILTSWYSMLMLLSTMPVLIFPFHVSQEDRNLLRGPSPTRQVF